MLSIDIEACGIVTVVNRAASIVGYTFEEDAIGGERHGGVAQANGIDNDAVQAAAVCRIRDIDSNRWDLECFAHADLRIVEGIAQFYTSVICQKMKERYPAALSAYEALLGLQSGPYVVHQDWVKIPGKGTPSPRAGEVVRASMVECRTRGIRDYNDFLRAVEHSHLRLSTR